MEIANILTKTGRPVNPILVSIYGVFNYIVILLVDKFLSFDYFLVFEFFALIFYFGFVFIYELIKSKTSTKKDILIKSLNTIVGCIYPILLFLLIVMINHSDRYSGIKNFSLIFIVMIFAITMLIEFHPEWFNVLHTYIFKYIFYGLMFLLWVWYVEKIRKPVSSSDKG